MRSYLIVAALFAFVTAATADEALDRQAREAVDAFKKAYASKEEHLRVAAVPLLGDPAHPLTIKALATLLNSDVDAVRVTAAETLAHFSGRKDVVPVLSAGLSANVNRPDVAKAIVTALGKSDDPAAAPVLEKYVKEMIPKRDVDDIEAERAGVDALGQLRWKAAVDSLLDLLQRNAVSGGRKGDGRHKSRANVADACKKALRGLTGEKHDNWREWKDWWEDSAKLYDDRLNKR